MSNWKYGAKIIEGVFLLHFEVSELAENKAEIVLCPSLTFIIYMFLRIKKEKLLEG